jgi:hypothetical protein
VGGRDAGALLGRAPRPGRRLRRQVRDGRRPPASCSRSCRGAAHAAPRADAGAAAHGGVRRPAARPRRRRGAVGRDGEPVVRYKLSRLRRAICASAWRARRRCTRRPARSGSSPRRAKWVAYEPGANGGRRRALHARRRRRGYGAGQSQLGSFHIMGSARMGGSPATSACDPNGRRGTCATCTCSTARPSRRRPA